MELETLESTANNAEDSSSDTTTDEVRVSLDEKAAGSYDPDDYPIFKPWPPWPYKLEVYKRNKMQIKNEILAGLSVAFAQVPESVAFAFLAGVDPQIGLNAAWIMGLMAACFGSRPGIIDGASGAIAAVVAAPVASLGTAALFPIIMIAGIIQTLCGLLKFGKFVRLIPLPAMIGFTNGLAIIIGLAQLPSFKVPTRGTMDTCESIEDNALGDWVFGPNLGFMLGLVAITALIVQFMPRLTKQVPSALVAIVIGIALEQILRLASSQRFCTPLVGEVAVVEGVIPTPFFITYGLPEFSLQSLLTFLPSGLIVALVSGIETLMTMELVSQKTETPTVNPNQQLMAEGIGNLIAGFFGTMGGGAVIGLSMLNIEMGANGRFRISAMTAALFMCLFTFVAAPIIRFLPMGTLVGIMLIIVTHTFNWRSLLLILNAFTPSRLRNKLKLKRKVNRLDAVVIIIVTVLTLIFDLFIAVLIGTLITAIGFSYKMSFKVKVEDKIVDVESSGDKSEEGARKGQMKVYDVYGPLFFASAMPLLKQFNFKTDPEFVEIHLRNTHIFDYTAMEMFNTLGKKYKDHGKQLHVKHMDVKSHKMVRKAHKLCEHFTYEITEEELHHPIGLHVAHGAQL